MAKNRHRRKPRMKPEPYNGRLNVPREISGVRPEQLRSHLYPKHKDVMEGALQRRRMEGPYEPGPWLNQKYGPRNNPVQGIAAVLDAQNRLQAMQREAAKAGGHPDTSGTGQAPAPYPAASARSRDANPNTAQNIPFFPRHDLPDAARREQHQLQHDPEAASRNPGPAHYEAQTPRTLDQARAQAYGRAQRGRPRGRRQRRR